MRQGRNILKILGIYYPNMCQFVFQFNQNFNKCLLLNNSIMKSLIFFFLLCLAGELFWGYIQFLLGWPKNFVWVLPSVQFSSVAPSCLTLCDPMDCSTPGLPVHHQLLEFTQTHVHWASNAIQLSHPLSSPSPPAFNLSQHQGLFKWVSFSHQVVKVLEFQLQHQSCQWTFRTDFL